MESRGYREAGFGIARDGFIEVNGLKLHYIDWGDHGKPTILLLHGACAHAHWWDFFALSLYEDYRVIALDQRGHGDSEWASPLAYRTLDYVGDIGGVIEGLGLRDVFLIGHSMGGHNSMVYGGISGSRRLRGLVVVDSLAYVNLEEEDFYKRLKERPLPIYNTLEEAIERFRLVPEETLASEDTLRHIAYHSVKRLPGGKWALKFDKNAFLLWSPLDARDYVGNIRCPVLFIRGEKSPVVSREHAEEIVGLCRSGSLREISMAYHHVFLDNEAEFKSVVEDFLRSL